MERMITIENNDLPITAAEYWKMLAADVREILEKEDIIKVVRCKECRHRPYKDEDGDVWPASWDDETCPCTCEDTYYNWMPEDDFFCKRGERKE